MSREAAWLKRNRSKPSIRENAVHTLFAGKGEGTWIFGARSRQRRKVFGKRDSGDFGRLPRQ